MGGGGEKPQGRISWALQMNILKKVHDYHEGISL